MRYGLDMEKNGGTKGLAEGDYSKDGGLPERLGRTVLRSVAMTHERVMKNGHSEGSHN